MRCFVLDDDKTFCNLIGDILRKSFANEVHCEMQFDSGLGYLKESLENLTSPDLIFVDFDLDEDRNGLDFIEKVVLLNQLSIFVLVTNSDDEDVLSKAEELGVLHIDKGNLSEDSLLNVSLHAIAKLTNQRSSALEEIHRQRHRLFELSSTIAHSMRSYVGAISQTFEVLNKRAIHFGFSNYISDIEEDVLEKVSDADYLCELLLKYGNLERIEVKCHEVSVLEILDIIQNDALVIEKTAKDATLEKSIFLDINALRTIVYNILDNAVSHCGRGTIVKAEVVLEDLAGVPILTIHFKDNGPGIDPHYSELIFEAGERAGKKLDYHKGGGLGLGLPFARELAKAHNHLSLEGDVFVDEELLPDTCFTVLIPGEVQ